MARKKVRAPFMSYEGTSPAERHVRITKSMLEGKSFTSLNYTSQVLYLHMKFWAGKQIQFAYSWTMAKKYFGSNRTYISAKDELIEKGFIECVETSKCSSSPNIYKFLSKWSEE